MSKRLSVSDRFWGKVAVQPNGCWLWTGALNDHGYGRFKIGRNSNVRAHRYSYELAGNTPCELLDHICHTQDKTCPGGACVHRRCVNPAHLEPTTRRANSLVGRSPYVVNHFESACMLGHAKTPDNIYVEPGTGKHRCRECRRRRAREQYARRRRD